MRYAAVVGALACLLAAAHAPAAERSLQLSSSAYGNGGAIPTRYTCVGKGVSPPLAWSGIPKGTRSLVLFFYDRDASDASNPRFPWVHWLLYDIPANAHRLTEGAAKDPPAGSHGGENSWKRSGYGGPCPPRGSHRYVLILYALDTVLPNLHDPGIQALKAAMRGHVLAQARLAGSYEKPR